MLIDAPFHAVTHQIIAAAIEVHRVLGPGLLESAYTPCLQYELTARKIYEFYCTNNRELEELEKVREQELQKE